MIKINIKKIFLYLLIIIVACLVIMAFYFNRYKFSGITTTKYTTVSLEYDTNISKLADKYSTDMTKSRFVSEIKEINDIDNPDYIPGNSTIIIPIIEFE